MSIKPLTDLTKIKYTALLQKDCYCIRTYDCVLQIYQNAREMEVIKISCINCVYNVVAVMNCLKGEH